MYIFINFYRETAPWWAVDMFQTEYVFSCWIFWVALILVPVVSLMRDFVWKVWAFFWIY